MTIADSEAYTVPEDGGRFTKWDVGWARSNCVVTGQVTVPSGGGKDVTVFVMSTDNYLKWATGERVPLSFSARIVDTGTVHATTSAPGTYALMIWNPDSLHTHAPKDVQIRNLRRTCTW